MITDTDADIVVNGTGDSVFHERRSIGRDLALAKRNNRDGP